MKRVTKWITIPQDVQRQNNRFAWLTVCDSHYFSFAESLIKSADLFSPGLVFVLHLINPDSATIELASSLVKKMANTSVYLSMEETDLSAISIDQLKTYYASARFFRILELLEEFQLDIISLDSDSLIVNKIDNDFTGKDEADICLIRRDIDKQVELNLAVATGTICSRFRPATLKFYRSLCEKLIEQCDSANLPWFLDQALFAEKMYEHKGSVTIRGIKRKYADWSFHKDSIVWAGKGDLKSSDLKFVTLQNLFSDNEYVRFKYLKSIYEFSGRNSLMRSSLFKKIQVITQAFRPLITIYLPRLDMPWKRFDNVNRTIPSLSNDALQLRVYWKQFCILLANALEREGLAVDIQEIPGWEITPEQINNSPGSFAFVPHRCKLDFDLSKVSIPVYFYMQEYFSWFFTVDEEGWSAASSVYPVDYSKIAVTEIDQYSRYQQLLSNNQLDSKFKQQPRKNIEELVASGQIPRHTDSRVPYRKFIFFPLQIPHDQSIKYFSDVDELFVIEALLAWSKKTSVPIVFKPHPANPKSMAHMIGFIRERGGYVSDASIHDLISLSHAVYTINSGVGFEAMFYNRPIVTFGRAEYDCVTHKANLNNLDMAWIYCLLSNANELKKGYAKFFNWFIGGYGYDLEDSEHIDDRFHSLALRVKSLIGTARI